MTAPRSSRLTLALVAFVASGTVLISGCASVGAAAGAAAGVGTGVATSNPAIGIGVGIAVQAATDEAVKRLMKRLHGDQQVAIATTAGTLNIGDTSTWRVKHFLPVENGHGDVRVLNETTNALATCREFMFSVADGDKPDAHEDWFFAQACKGDNGAWKWASAEPAVARWGNLQ
jgi:hypothetical protein